MSIEYDIRGYLVSWRARLRPEIVGIRAGSDVPRVPGLRREKVAERAGASVDYYIRRERGRVAGLSNSVLDALARALLLVPAERQHLVALASGRRAPETVTSISVVLS
jgi:hypothetical protein